MKTIALLAFSMLPLFAAAQTPDSTVIKQVDSLLQISRSHLRNDLNKALEIAFAAKKLSFEKLGRETQTYSKSCNYYGIALKFIGDYEEAAKWYLESIAVDEKTIGKEHADYAGNLINLAGIYRLLSYFEKSELLLLDAKNIFENKLHDRNHPFYYNCLIVLANLYSMTGEYEKAEPLYLEAKAIREKSSGKDPYLFNLAILYSVMGNYEKAEQLYFETLTAAEMEWGKEHINYAAILDNLGINYKRRGAYKKAESLYLESMTIRERELGKEHLDYATSLYNLASLYKEMGDYEKAEKFILEALPVYEKTVGKDNYSFGRSLIGLTSMYMDKGDYNEAETILLQAKSIIEKTMGKQHPDNESLLLNLATICMVSNDYGKASACFVDLSKLNQSLIVRASHHLSERELAMYKVKFSVGHDRLLSFAQTFAGNKSEIASACFDNLLFYKGFLLQASGQVKRLAISDPNAAENFNLLKSYQRRLSAQYAQPIAERDSTAVADLEAKANDLEKELARTVAGFGEAMRQVKWQEVKQALKPDEAVIEFVHFRFYEKKQTDSTMYAALVLLPGSSQPTFIPLFEEMQLDSLLLTQGERRADYVNGLYTVAERGAKPLGKPQKSLYELLWQPLEKQLGNAKTVYFSSAGLLHRLNLGAIPISEEETLADRYRLVELGSSRQLVVNSWQSAVGSQSAVLFGGVQYEMDSTAIATANASIANEDMASRGGLSFTYADSTLRGGTWSYLKWTDKEVTALEPILKNAGIQASARKGFAATEESFKAIGIGGTSPRILHVATHGFFFPDPRSGSPLGAGGNEPVFKISDHPMIRSGLLLAGGNHAWQTGKPLKPGMDDGILTAYEISQMNLSNTELVVLSACETGLGDIQGNEGVYGLQRAFKIAGAKYLVMSLWQVPDQETSVFMTTFYKHWLEGKMTIPDAFRTTQREMRERFINPYQWAGFVLVE